MTVEAESTEQTAPKWGLGCVCSCGCVAILFLIGIGLVGAWYLTQGEVMVRPDANGNDQKLDPMSRSLKRLEKPLVAEQDDDGFLAGLVLAELSLHVYDPPETADTKARELGFASGRAIVHDNLVAWICRRPGVIVIAFQGTTDDLADWFANGQIRRELVRGGAMHHGFQRAYQTFKADIDGELAKTPNDRVWITGHSLGGALAMSCGHDQALVEQRSLAGIITFGQPRLLGPKLRKNLRPVLESQTLRFVHGQDIVPRVPPNYRHFADEIHFLDGGYRRNPDPESRTGEANTTSQGEEDDSGTVEDHRTELKGVRVGRRGRAAGITAANPRIEDHSMEHYLDRLREQVGP